MNKCKCGKKIEDALDLCDNCMLIGMPNILNEEPAYAQPVVSVLIENIAIISCIIERLRKIKPKRVIDANTVRAYLYLLSMRIDTSNRTQLFYEGAKAFSILGTEFSGQNGMIKYEEREARDLKKYLTSESKGELDVILRKYGLASSRELWIVVVADFLKNVFGTPDKNIPDVIQSLTGAVALTFILDTLKKFN